MHRYRISIASTLFGVLVLALALAAARSGTRSGAQAVEATAMIAKTAAIAGAVVARGRARAFWLGFALFGWQFFGTPYPTESQGAHVTGARELAHAASIALHPYAERSASGPVVTGPSAEIVSVDLMRNVYVYDDGHRAQHSEAAILGLANLAYAALGGALAIAIASGQRKRERPGQGDQP